MTVSSSIRRRAAAVVIAVATGVTLSIVDATPGLAAPARTGTAGMSVAAALQIDELECLSEGASRYWCTVRWSGGVPLYTIRWYKFGAHMSAYDNLSGFGQSCAARTTLEIRVVVADSTGASVEASRRVTCYGGPAW